MTTEALAQPHPSVVVSAVHAHRPDDLHAAGPRVGDGGGCSERHGTPVPARLGRAAHPRGNIRRHTLAPFATDVLVVDETTLDKVGRLLPALRDLPERADALFPGKLTALFDLRRQLLRQVSHVPYVHQNERASLPHLLEQLTAGMLLVFDLG